MSHSGRPNPDYRDMSHRQARHPTDRYERTTYHDGFAFDTSAVLVTRPLDDQTMTSAPHLPSASVTATFLPRYDTAVPQHQVSKLPPPGPRPEMWPNMEAQIPRHRLSTSVPALQASPMDRWYRNDQGNSGSSPEKYYLGGGSNPSRSSMDSVYDDVIITPGSTKPRANHKGTPQRRPSNRDEFDGPHQFLDRPVNRMPSPQERDMPQLSTNLLVNEQDEVLNNVNDCLSKCAFSFVAKYQFPIPIEADKRPVKTPSDREWTEWVYLLKRLATKRRIPARVLYNGQIKQFVTILENSLEMRHAAKHQSRPVKDDRNVLQLISAGLQVAKILKDPQAMEYLDHLYAQTEALINSRKEQKTFMDQGPFRVL